MNSKSKTSLHPLKHVAIIMDGNNRWAKQRGLSGIAGHRAGAERIRDILPSARNLGVQTVSLFAFSSENWLRPPMEVRGLMSLFSTYLKKEAKPKLCKRKSAILLPYMPKKFLIFILLSP